MSANIRKQIYIEPDQEARLKQLANLTNLSQAEIIRQAIDQYAKSWDAEWLRLTAWKSKRAFIQQLISTGPVSVDCTWQRDELYDR